MSKPHKYTLYCMGVGHITSPPLYPPGGHSPTMKNGAHHCMFHRYDHLTAFTCSVILLQRGSLLSVLLSIQRRTLTFHLFKMDCRFQIISIAILLIVVPTFAQHDHHDHEHHRVHVTVYYESLCPDSIKFFTKQLYPSLQGNLSNYVNLTLLPYGRAKLKMEGNQYDFKCHHGPAECEGNRIQACAIRLINGGRPTEGLGFNKVTTGFINCLMDKVQRNGAEATFPTQNCATINNVENLSDIQNCANHPDGSSFLADIGKLTEALNPPLKSVPTIVFNKQYKQEDNDLAQNNFVKALCQYIDHDKPAECSRSGALKNIGSTLSITILTFIAFLF